MYRNILKAFSTAVIAVLPGCVSMSGISTTAQPRDANSLQAGQDIAHARHDLPWPKEDWWRAYQDPALNALVERSLADHPDIHAARARVAMAEAQAQTVAAARAPQASLNGSLIRERFTDLQFIPPPWNGHTEWNNKATANLSYDLDLWGRREQQWKGALDSASAAAVEAQQVKLSLATAVVRHYVDLSREYALHHIIETRIEIAGKKRDITQRALAAGLSTEIAVTEVETAIPVLRSQLEASAERITLLKQQLAVLSGQGPGATEALERPTLALHVDIGLPDNVPASLVGRRPDLVAARWRIEAASHDVASAKAAFYPDINLLSFAGLQAMGFSHLLSNAAGVAGVGPALSLPLFDGGRRRGNLAAQGAAYDIAVEQYNSILLQALQDVSGQLVVLHSNAGQHEEIHTALALAEKSRKLASVRNQAGLANYLQVLEAENQVLNQQATLIELDAVRLSTYAGLMQALGGGVIATDTSPANTMAARVH
ncbi:efflux transporter outer membrane subunit [Methylobacillus arboreus]|uniref:efflux transporter outer membrane subunit n=1 Tax=Methylobacillus arboreus TaxID=755170 RepID=UPI001E4A0312|nr:efflux transporter outer membrane subunit [Methylobacillus arboreus]MCB5190793.1 efflux transporter outer membrane subunit [Methylobacillus arboreus]